VSAKGKFTKRMMNEVKEGDIIWIKLPYGDFVFNNNDNNLVLIAGGTGITPFISYLEYCLDSHNDQTIKLYYGVRNPEHLIFFDLIGQCERHLSRFSSVIYLEDGETTDFRPGILDVEAIYAETSQGTSTYYLSGPRNMINAFRSKLKALGVIESHIRIDEWE
jgi:ferredoxin-NADP reductase